MDILSVLGILIALGSIVGGQHLEGGHLSSILQFTAFLIVFGGTIGAVMLQFPLSIFMKSLGAAGMVFGNVTVDMKGVITQVVELSNVSRKQGLLALEGQMLLWRKESNLSWMGRNPPRSVKFLRSKLG
jgi:chemotaxis protein MotA